MRLDRFCVHCLKDLPPDAELRQFFCPTQGGEQRASMSACWRIWQKWRRRIRDSSESMAEFDATMSACGKRPKETQKHAETEAQGDDATEKPAKTQGSRIKIFSGPYWYRLQITIGEISWLYPAVDRPTPRFDGMKRQTPGFRISPFEPPVVPVEGDYHPSFYDAHGNLLPIPKGYYEFHLEPVILLPVESGAILRDFRKKT